MAEEQKPDPKEKYDLSDTGFDPKLDTPFFEQVVAAPVVATEKPRGPDGKFLKQTPEPEKAAPPKHSARMTKIASDYGLSASDIEEMSPAELNEEIRDLRWQFAIYQLQNKNQPEPQPQIQAEPEEKFELGLTPEERETYNTPMLSAIEKNMAKLAKENSDLRKEMEGLKNNEQKRRMETEVEFFHRKLAERPDKFGAKPGTYKVGTPERAAANAVWSVARTLTGSREERIEQAISMLFGKVESAEPVQAPEKLPPNAPQSVIERWNSSGVARPTQRNGSAEPKGPERAARHVATYLGTANGYMGFERGNEEDSLP